MFIGTVTSLLVLGNHKAATCRRNNEVVEGKTIHIPSSMLQITN